MFDRYNIVNEDDMLDAGKAVEAYLDRFTGTVRAQIVEIDAVWERRRDANA